MMKKAWFVFFLSAMLSPISMYAQDSLSKSINVIVGDSITKETVVGAVVTLLTDSGEYVASLETDIGGTCILNDVFLGTYKLKVEYIGTTRILPIVVKDNMLVKVKIPKVRTTVCFLETPAGFTTLDNDSYGGKMHLPNQIMQNLMP